MKRTARCRASFLVNFLQHHLGDGSLRIAETDIAQVSSAVSALADAAVLAVVADVDATCGPSDSKAWRDVWTEIMHALSTTSIPAEDLPHRCEELMGPILRKNGFKPIKREEAALDDVGGASSDFAPPVTGTVCSTLVTFAQVHGFQDDSSLQSLDCEPVLANSFDAKLLRPTQKVDLCFLNRFRRHVAARMADFQDVGSDAVEIDLLCKDKVPVATFIREDMAFYCIGEVALTSGAHCVPLGKAFGLDLFTNGTQHADVSQQLPLVAWMARVVPEDDATFIFKEETMKRG